MRLHAKSTQIPGRIILEGARDLETQRRITLLIGSLHEELEIRCAKLMPEPTVYGPVVGRGGVILVFHFTNKMRFLR